MGTARPPLAFFHPLLHTTGGGHITWHYQSWVTNNHISWIPHLGVMKEIREPMQNIEVYINYMK